ncbi:DotA/TraY family protein, partial [Burkholderia cenocepacia]|uniref:DotA/TraY family protein n=1 Tax=Burkholderia cenocepacia TaxID=95486 RepID=UPI001558BDE7
FTPVANDISVQLLNAIFPGLVGNGGADAVASAMGIFNGCILVVGGILATYTLLAGTIGTAHDGEMLGKKFSSIWIPIRYALGTALVLPVVGGGYNIMQQIVMWIVM